MVTNDDARYCGKLLFIIKNTNDSATAVYYYRNEHYIVPGTVEYSADSANPIFHAHWGDDLADKFNGPLIIEG